MRLDADSRKIPSSAGASVQAASGVSALAAGFRVDGIGGMDAKGRLWYNSREQERKLR